jgi:SAM-dependent methyltransferase
VRTIKRAMVRAVADDRSIAGRSLPVHPDQGAFILRPPTAVAEGSGPADWPLPDPAHWELEDEPDPVAYLRSGELPATTIRDVVAAHGLRLGPGHRVLELGCGYGRVLRWFGDLADEGEVWGVDLDAGRIAWCRANLPPSLRVAACTTAPHLPFPDGSFDLLYACSVVPHISELADAWLLELRRVLAPGALAYLTVYDESTVDAIRRTGASPNLRAGLDALEARDGPLDRGFDVAVLSRRPGSAQVIYSRDCLDRVWGRWFDIVERRPEDFHLQTAMVLRREGPPR